MKTKSLLVTALIAAAGVALVCAYFFWPSDEHNYTNLPPRTVIELQHEKTPIWLEKHYIDSDGVKVQSDVIYRNGETGTRFWRKDGTLSREIIRFKDGRQRMNAVFAADGEQIISGNMIRVDGSTVWEAVLGPKEMVTTSTYWYNGKLFETEKRQVGKPVTDQTFFYQSGNKWQHFIGIHDGRSLPQLEEIWNEDGTTKFTHYSGITEASFDSIYRDDGTLAFKQYWILKPVQWFPEDTPIAMRRLLLKVESFSRDGKRMEREYMMDSFGNWPERVVDRLPDGSKIEYMLLYDRSVYLRTKIDAKGRTVEQTRFTARTTFKIGMATEFTGNYVNDLDPRILWRDLEDHPEKRP